ncbi:MAG: cytochrome c maturation protein CcmE [Desulfovibrio sp.]|jgi:cytochrome c-type biogenesis protein CcmE|nr:cytochrome c maturation protein CcmE [Desulfovibrio sp.]
MSHNKNTPIYLIAFLLFLGGVSYLCYFGFSENSIYFLNVAEARTASPDKLVNARLFGTVAEDGLKNPANGSGVIFRLEDKDNTAQTILVNYVGPVPDTFKPGAEVIVEGGISGKGYFTAKTLMTKCPSKYQKENRKS